MSSPVALALRSIFRRRRATFVGGKRGRVGDGRRRDHVDPAERALIERRRHRLTQVVVETAVLAPLLARLRRR